MKNKSFSIRFYTQRCSFLRITGLLCLTAVLSFYTLSTAAARNYNEPYKGEYLNRVAFPIGGIGAGMVCLEGNGCISHVSVRNTPDIFNEPFMFAAVSVKEQKNGTKLLEGPVQNWKIFGNAGTGNGAGETSYGFPRFETAEFSVRFPFGTVSLHDPDIPMEVTITGWSPFIPGDADNSSLPAGALEYTFTNTSNKELDAMFSYNVSNFMRISGRNAGSNTIQSMNGGLVLFQDAATSLPDAGFYEKSEFFSRDNEGKEIKGLAGEFFTNMAFQGQPVLKQVAEIINLEWETDSPFPGVPAIQMSARWSGFIKVEQAGPYKFAVSGDDGYRLLIDEKVVLENWSEHAEEVSVTVVNLEKDREYPVQLQFYQNSGGAAIRLGYQPVSETDTDKSMQGHFAFFTDNTDVVVDHCWFRGGWFDSRTILWQDIVNFNMPSRQPRDNAPGGSMYVPFKLKPGETESIKLLFCWYVPSTRLKYGETPPETEETAKCCSTSTQCCMPSGEFFEPWYAGKFKDIRDVARYWQKNYADLKQKTLLFTDTFYDTNLPPEVVEAVAANLTILKSPTVLRQKDGRLWAWEGCHDLGGCCAGSCTHVWNYAQAISRLFPELERSLRNTEFKNSQNDKGHQTFRASLPIRSAAHNFHAAADGQLGGIMKMYREWRISGDTEWLKSLWPKVKQSFDYCSQTWDPNGKGVLEEPHHNTYDIEFWGPDGMCSSFYLGATQAMIKMGRALNEDVSHYEKLLAKGKKFMERELWDGEYFYQKVVWEGLQTPNPLQEITQAWNISYSNEALELFRAEGPKYQYGKGCISDGVLGCWIAEMCGLPRFLDGDKVKGHLVSVHKYNLRRDLLDHVNPQRPSFACGDDGGLLLCTWPKGGQLSLPFVYSNEVWTGIEYQAASHLMCMGEVEKGLEIVRTARDRYDGRKRNPFNEYECGHWYARAMASYGLIQGMTGVFYDAVDQILYVDSRMGEDFKSFLSTETGWGSAGLNGGKPFLNVQYGVIGVKKVVVSGEEVEMD